MCPQAIASSEAPPGLRPPQSAQPASQAPERAVPGAELADRACATRRSEDPPRKHQNAADRELDSLFPSGAGTPNGNTRQRLGKPRWGHLPTSSVLHCGCAGTSIPEKRNYPSIVLISTANHCEVLSGLGAACKRLTCLNPSFAKTLSKLPCHILMPPTISRGG